MSNQSNSNRNAWWAPTCDAPVHLLPVPVCACCLCVPTFAHQVVCCSLHQQGNGHTQCSRLAADWAHLLLRILALHALALESMQCLSVVVPFMVLLRSVGVVALGGRTYLHELHGG